MGPDHRYKRGVGICARFPVSFDHVGHSTFEVSVGSVFMHRAGAPIGR